MRLVHPKKQLGKKIVVIVGAGFAGLNAAKALSVYPELHIVLIDQRNHHLFQPLLYQVATAGLNPADIAVPIRSQFSGIDNVEVKLEKIARIDLETQDVQRDNVNEKLPYDYLILACGARDNYFSHPEWAAVAPGLKSLEQATEIRRRILVAFEEAENEFNIEKQMALLTFVVVGGGPTGVELAGAIADISKTVLIRDFRRINPGQAKVILIEASPRVLASFSERVSVKAREDLTQLGVDVRTHSRVEEIDANGVVINKERIAAKNVFWAAGVQAAQLECAQNMAREKGGRIKVLKDLSVPGFKNAFVIGDMAAVEWEEGKFVPGLAPAAIQQGIHIADVIKADYQNKPRPEFKYLDKGAMATIGKHKAVLEVKKFWMSGYLAWLAWLFIHVFYLVGFKNRVAVVAYWAWSYLFSKRGARLITGTESHRRST
ncbi:MAG: NAD(P)/FAD-dependent oxidoreductase [Bdellovibrionaceae bacterium]|nr:NAD(P)/FAD-dependent oxidoreductase [Pseudobdellovibrionaceae bacterium]